MNHTDQPGSALAIGSTQAQALAPITMPQPVNKQALKAYLAQIEDEESLELQKRMAGAYDRACRALLGPDDIQKERDRDFKKKSAWQKLAKYFTISTQVVSVEIRYVNDVATGESYFVAICISRGVAPWGQIADAIGACSQDEESGKRKITIADALATAQTRATNRATSNLIAMGEVSFEEMSRTAPQAVEQEVVKELTLEEAKAYPFPWTKPEKYKGKPLGELSHGMLNTVREAVGQEIADKGETRKRNELVQACRLIVADIEANPDSYPERQRQKQAKEGATEKTREPGEEEGEEPGAEKKEDKPAAKK